MTINPHTLPDDFLECPADCPFLGMRTFLPNTLPFYCNQYETFLGANPHSKILRCFKCRGVVQHITTEGLSYIDSYIGVPKEETKKAFLNLDHHFQKMFVDLISKTGIQIVLDSTDPDKPTNLADEILKKWQESRDRSGSPDLQRFEDLLDADGMPVINRQTKTLLMNLFQVLDNSEKEMIKNILQNPKQIDSFLDHFEHQPQDKDLLRNVRALVYDFDRRSKEMERIRMQDERTRQQQMDLERMLILQRERSRGGRTR